MSTFLKSSTAWLVALLIVAGSAATQAQSTRTGRSLSSRFSSGLSSHSNTPKIKVARPSHESDSVQTVSYESEQSETTRRAPRPQFDSRRMTEPSGVVFATDQGNPRTYTARQDSQLSPTRYYQGQTIPSPVDMQGGTDYCEMASCSTGNDDCGSCYSCDQGGCDCECNSCDTCCDTCCGGCDSSGCCNPWWAHKTSVFGEFLYYQAYDADVTHAQQQNGIGGAGTVPFGRIGRIDPDFEPGFRVGMNKRISDRSSMFASYTQYESAAIDQLTPPVIPGGGGAIGSLVHHPGATITASAGPVDAFYDINFQLGDFGVRRVWKGCKDYVINWSLGGRYGHLEQRFLQSGVYSGGSAGRINTLTNVDFDGGGFRFGLDGERRFGCRGFSIYGNINVSPMFGTMQADYDMRNISTDVLLAQSVWKDDRVLTTLDYEAGIAWTGKKNKWRVSAGWSASHWFNAVTTDSWINGVQNNNYVDIDGALSFGGLVARVERKF